jgi:hypothetical protein
VWRVIHGAIASFRAISIAVFALLATGCGDVDAVLGRATGAGGSAASGSSSASAGPSSATSGGGGDDGRDWRNLDWPGLPCPLELGGPTAEPTLAWKPCAAMGCSFIDTTPFTEGSVAVTATHVFGTTVTGVVHRAGGYDAVAWDATTGHERFAIRGHSQCMAFHIVPFLFQGEERAWVATFSNGDFQDAAHYEADLNTLSATLLDAPALSSSRLAGDADRLVAKGSLPLHWVWSRSTGKFTWLPQETTFAGLAPGGVYFVAPDGAGDPDLFWWQNGSITPAVVGSAAIFSPAAAGDSLVWTEATDWGAPGLVKRVSLSSSFPWNGEAMAPLDHTLAGPASTRFYVSAGTVSGAYLLQVVDLATTSVSTIELPPEAKWPVRVDFVGQDSFGTKEVAWVQANETVYRIEIE